MVSIAFRGLLLALVLGPGLSACTVNPVWSDVLGATWSGRYSASHDPTASTPVNPTLNYLRVEATGAPAALLVLGYVDEHPDGPIEVWYSAQGEVLRLLQGRIVGTAGLPVDWARVWFDKPLPAWNQVPPGGLSLMRWHDQRQAYVGGRQTHLMLRRIGTPASLPLRLSSGGLAEVQWFEETSTQARAGSVPPSVYAVGRYKGRERVIYSKQCLSSQLCLSMQLWPPEAMQP